MSSMVPEGIITAVYISKKYTLGIVLILAVAVIWVAGSEVVQVIFEDRNFDKPLFLTFYNFVNYTLGLLICGIQTIYRRKLFARREEEDSDSSNEPGLPISEAKEEVSCYRVSGAVGAGSELRERPLNRNVTTECEVGLPIEIANPDPTPTNREVAWIALQFTPICFAANYMFNLGLGLTSVASNTVLASTSSLFTLIFSMFSGEALDVVKAGSVLITVLGALLVALFDGKSPESHSPNHYIGDLCALSSAVLYAIYCMMLKVKVSNEDTFPMTLFWGFVGLFSMTLLWPLLLVWHALGWEEFGLPDGGTALFLWVNGLVGVNLATALWAKSVLLTTPLVATIGVNINIPFAMLYDFFFKHISISFGYFIGTVLIMSGFVLVNCGAFIRQSFQRLQRRPVGGVDSDSDDSRGSQ